jgi:hypothetical protein
VRETEINKFESTSSQNNSENPIINPPADNLESQSNQTKKRQEQHAAILDVIKQLGYSPMSVPVGGRDKIKEICHDNEKFKKLFKFKTSFRTAWEDGHHLFKLEKHEQYAKRDK